MKTYSTAALVFCQCEFKMLQNIKASFLNLPETFKFCQSGDFLPNLVTLILARKLIEIATLPNDKKSTHLIRKTVLNRIFTYVAPAGTAGLPIVDQFNYVLSAAGANV